MLFEIERIRKILDYVHEGVYTHRRPITGIRLKPCGYNAYALLHADDSGWETFQPGTRWGGRDAHVWMRFDVKLEPADAGRAVVCLLDTGRKGWDATNPQFMAFVDGRPALGLDVNHRELLLTEHARGDEHFTVDLDAYGGMEDSPAELDATLAVCERDTEKLFYDVTVPLEVAELLDEEDKHRIDIMKCLNEAVRRLDLRVMHSPAYEASVKDALSYLETEFYGKCCRPGEVTETCVGHTHIDVAWLWTLAQTQEKSVRSFSTVLNLMKQYPEYIFMSSQPQLYQFVKQNVPEVFEGIQARVRDGRWEPEGSMWLEADCNLISGESMVRQLLYGKRFFRREFGKECKILWLPDVFGYSAALPQILKKSGVDYFMTIKISWNEVNTFPYDTFMWQGIDGTRILSHFITTTKFQKDGKAGRNTTYNSDMSTSEVMGCWQRYHQKELSSEVLNCYGFGDGGGGPTKDMLERARRLSKGIPGCPTVKLGDSLGFFQRMEQRVKGNPRLPDWVGELYLEYHRGTYTTMARNKRFNRKQEFRNRDAELFSTAACLVDPQAVYPKDRLDDCWHITLLNQFHDIIPGSSIHEVYEDSKAQYERVGAVGDEMIDQALQTIGRAVVLPETSALVFNRLDLTANDIVRANLPAGWESARVFDGGRELPAQKDGDGVLFIARDVPPMGYKAFTLRRGEPAVAGGLSAGPDRLQNGRYDIRLGRDGRIVSLFDKAAGREVAAPGRSLNSLQAFDDRPTTYDAWNVDIGFEEKMWDVTDVERIEVTECGPVRASLRIVRRFGSSVIDQTIHIYDGVDRIDFDTTVDWKESHVLLKAAFPVDVHAEKAAFDIQFGNVERPTHHNTSWDVARFEECAHKWADVSEAGYGVGMLNESKYGCDVHDGVLRLTLLRAPEDPNPTADREIHHFTYSLVPHVGGWREGGVVQQAYLLNCPMTARTAPAQKGTLAPQRSFFSSDARNVLIDTVKMAEDGSGIILRLYEFENRRGPVHVTCPGVPGSVTECDLMENELGAVETQGDGFAFEAHPYEIRTFKVRL